MLNNSGSLTENGTWYLGYNGTDTSRLNNLAGATFTIAGSSASIYSAAGALLTNAGTLVESGGGLSQINAAVTSTGSISITTGTLRFAGTSNSFAGTVGGSGTLDLYSGAQLFAAGLTLGVAHVLLEGTSLTLAGDQYYGKEWTQTGGTLAMGGHLLALSGAANFDGGIANGAGNIRIVGSAEVSSYIVEGNVALNVLGTVTQTGYWFLGYYGTDTVALNNHTGATITMAGATTMNGTLGSLLNNDGTLVKAGIRRSTSPLITAAPSSSRTARSI